MDLLVCYRGLSLYNTDYDSEALFDLLLFRDSTLNIVSDRKRPMPVGLEATLLEGERYSVS